MQPTRRSRKTQRLERLLCSDLRPTEDLEAYAADLKKLARDVADEELVDRKSRLLKAIANETRLKMLRLLSEREMCVCELTVALDMTQPTASHHLNILENMRLIKDRKEGRWVFYSVANRELVQHLFDFLEFSHVS
ncbi:MAG: winged helix-turn-helix transcriptional regulator [Candidatus Bathyarchaeota archaeon]|nr:MAG: winged helix-turn-helix transcriptional regulator [Candidatus Bathyarchaeota archaeon]